MLCATVLSNSLIGNIYRNNRVCEDTDKFVEVNKMLGHISRQNQINDPLAYEFERVTVQILEYVHPFIRHGQLETESSMVVF